MKNGMYLVEQRVHKRKYDVHMGTCFTENGFVVKWLRSEVRNLKKITKNCGDSASYRNVKLSF